MYLSFFGLNEKPFAITPDPRYLFLSERHAEALAHLIYGINEAGGFIQLTGEVGTGKTTIIRSLLAQAPRNAEVALILNPRITAPEFLLTICEELGIGVPDDAVGSVKDLVDILNRYLLRAHGEGRRVVLVVDEAQNLAPDVLEQVRLLTNLETETHKLLQIILIGQPELRELLGRSDLRQLAQRVTGRYHLDPLSSDETAAYLRHRLRVAGATNDIFTPYALRETYRLAEGVPRLINIIADRALLGAYTQDQHRVSRSLVQRAAGEVFGRRMTPAWLPWALGGGALAIAVLAALLWWRSSSTASASGSIMALTPARPAAASARASVAVLTPAAGSVAAPAAGSAPMASWLSSANGANSPTAYQSLFALWHANYSARGGAVCQQAQANGLGCVESQGSLAQLRLYNRPALLTLVHGAGATRDVVLSALKDDRATLLVDGAAREVAVAELTRYWFGDYLLLWQPGSIGSSPLAFGAHGANVRQLRIRLLQLAGRPVPAKPLGRYDAELLNQVEEFQRRNRLHNDGVAGLQTLLALDSALPAPGTPLLGASNRTGAIN